MWLFGGSLMSQMFRLGFYAQLAWNHDLMITDFLI